MRRPIWGMSAPFLPIAIFVNICAHLCLAIGPASRINLFFPPTALIPKGTLQHRFVQSWLSVLYTYSLQGQGQVLADHGVGRLMFNAIADCSFPLRIIRLGVGCSMQAAVDAARCSSAFARQVSLH